MESLQTLKSRLGAVKNIGQITKAMEVVSATKMRKAQEVALSTRNYAFRSLSLLNRIVRNSNDDILNHSLLLATREVKKTLILLVESDRGLAGAFNSQVSRALDKYIATQNVDSSEKIYISVGKKAHQFLSNKKIAVLESHGGFGSFIKTEEILPLAKKIIAGFLDEAWDEVITISTHFHSTLKQETLVRKLLPVSIEGIKETVAEMIPETGKYSDINKTFFEETGNVTDYILEPSPKEVIEAIIPHLVNMQIYQLVLEANASEHSARMVAMKSASDNAKELSTGLQLEYNKARQAGITKEIIEITSTQAALG